MVSQEAFMEVLSLSLPFKNIGVEFMIQERNSILEATYVHGEEFERDVEKVIRVKV